MIKAVIFDCFGVFYPDPVFAYMREPATPPEKAKALHSLDEQAARGEIDKRGFVSQAASIVGITEDEAERRFFHSTERNEHLVKFVEELRQHYKVAMLSNIGGDMMDGFFSPKELEKLFDVVILSGTVKIAKPDRSIFELTCKNLGVQLDEAVMVDDVQSTCRIVETFGMKGVRYQNLEQCKSDLAVILQ